MAGDKLQTLKITTRGKGYEGSVKGERFSLLSQSREKGTGGKTKNGPYIIALVKEA